MSQPALDPNCGTCNWSRQHATCRNCRTERHAHRGRGYCTRCYPLIRKIEQAQRWNLADPTTLENCFWAGFIYDEESFERVRQNYIQQITERLEFLRMREIKLSNPVDGLDIEYGLRFLLTRAGVRDSNILHGIASTFNEEFDSNQKAILFRCLNTIQESILWRGIDYYRLFDSG